MATQTKPIIVSLGGGLVLNKDVFSMQPGEALQLQNFEPNISGGYSKILGTGKYNTNIVPQVSSSSERVVMSAIFNDVVLAARGGTIVRGSSGSGSWTSTITSLGTPTRNYEFRKFNFDGTEKIVIATGTSNPQILDASFSTTNVNATGTSNYKFVEIFKNHLFFAGHSSNEQEISFMGPFQTNDFTSGNGGGTIKVDTEIVGLKVFRENLFIFGKDKIFKLSGTALADFAVAPVTRNIGCIDGGSIQELAGDVVFLAPDGLRTIAGTARIGDVELGTISKQVQKRIDDITTHNINSLVIRSKSQYRLFFPTSTSQAEQAAQGLIAVIKTNPATGQLGFEYADMKQIKVSACDSDFISGTETIVHGGYDGFVYKQETGNELTRASTTATIDSFYRSPDLHMGDPGIRKKMQRVIFNYDNTGNVSATFKLVYDFADPNSPQPSSFSLTTGAGVALYDLAATTYGTAVYDSSGASLVRQPVEGSGFTVAVRLDDTSTNPPLELKGYEMEFIPGDRR